MLFAKALARVSIAMLLVCGEAQAAPRISRKSVVAQDGNAVLVRKPQTREEASQAMAKNLWEHMLSVRKLSAGKRRALAEQVHKASREMTFTKPDEGLILLALAVLHSFDKPVMHAALPLVLQAKSRWPELVYSKDLPAVWEIFVDQFHGDDVRSRATLSGIAAAVDGQMLQNSDPRGFSYFRALARFSAGEWSAALSSLVRVPLDSENYRNAKFLEGMALVELGRLNDARDALQMVVALDRTEAEEKAGVSTGDVQRLRERGVLSIARILYEQGHFAEALAYYRTLTQDSFYFYESLAEQGWAFFMAGYPNRAMGAVHAAASPFFSNRFNPDIRFLDAVVSYWLCDYAVSSIKVQKYIDHARNEGDVTRNTVARNEAHPDALLRYARIAEDSVRGVSAKNLGIGRKVQSTLLENEGVKEALEGLSRLISSRGAFSRSQAYPNGKARLEAALAEFENQLRKALGRQVRANLRQQAGDFDKTLVQSRILYLELLTAKKDAIVGKGRTVSGAEFSGDEKEFLDLGSQDSKSWVQDKNEYWFDELGHYVFQVKSRCGSSNDKEGSK